MCRWSMWSSFVARSCRNRHVTLLAVGIPLLAEVTGNLALAIQPLLDLLTGYAPTPSYLTTIHPVFLRTCVSTRHFAAALLVRAHPITSIDTSISDLTYNDKLVYHYVRVMLYAALKRWAGAQEFFEICACSPGSAAGARWKCSKSSFSYS
ncbi:hypothetical protein V8E55_007305 [Tylopilus felleus]